MHRAPGASTTLEWRSPGARREFARLLLVDVRGRTVASRPLPPASKAGVWELEKAGNRRALPRGAYFAVLMEGQRAAAVARVLVTR